VAQHFVVKNNMQALVYLCNGIIRLRPGEECSVPLEYRNHPDVETFLKAGNLVLATSKAAPAPAPEPVAAAPEPVEPVEPETVEDEAETVEDEAEDAEEEELDAADMMKESKKALQVRCDSAGIEYLPADKKALLVEKLLEA